MWCVRTKETTLAAWSRHGALSVSRGGQGKRSGPDSSTVMTAWVKLCRARSGHASIGMHTRRNISLKLGDGPV
jgi:hypothetical protein